MTTITYFDLASEYYMAYPLDGLLMGADGRGWKFRIAKKPPSILCDIDLPRKDTERLFALGIFQVSSGTCTKWFCIDAHDNSAPEGYFGPVLEKFEHYFKLNYDPSVFVKDPELARFKAKIHPLGCTFAIRPARPWLFLPRLTPCKAYGWNWFSIKRRLRSLQRNPSLQWYRDLRLRRPDKDVFLVRRYYHESGHFQSNLNCLRIFESVKKMSSVSGYMGFTAKSGAMPEDFRKYALGPDRLMRDHLFLLARSRVCIYMPGTYNCLSFKFGQYLALGKPIVGLKLPFWPVPEMDEDDKKLLEEQFCCTEPEQIAAKVLELLRDTKRLDFLKANNIRIFERYFSPQSVARGILNRVLHT